MHFVLQISNEKPQFCVSFTHTSNQFYLFIMKKHFLSLFLLANALLLLGQNAQRIPGKIIVQLQKGADIRRLLTPNLRLAAPVWVSRTLSDEWNVHLLEFDETALNATPVLAAIQNAHSVIHAMFDETIEYRSEPNDPKWAQQADMRLINAPAAWEASTGGTTPQGDTIVVAILEKGMQFSHPDLIPNFWFNRKEIPNNDKDDDENGFVDDYQGYDVRNGGSGPGNSGSHGTSVAAICGARGDDGVGVTGVNWYVKLMPVTNVDALSEVVAGYDYVLKMRRLYNQSQGTKGAFIVATNASFGRDNKFPTFFPAWCDAYQTLGLEGVLNVGATSNANNNVDDVGDLPSTCPSEFLMVATNVTAISGNKVASAGFGRTHVDLGAPGDGTITAENGPTYGDFGGTSSATPHVTGAIALTYSYQCNAVSSDRLSDPAATARRVRDLIMDNVVPNPTLAGITSTEGRLDLGTTLAAVRNLCKGAIGPLQILKVETDNYNRYQVYYQALSSSVTYKFRVFNMLGQLMYEKSVVPKQFEANIIEFDANILPAGIYTFSISDVRNIVSRKFAKM